MSMLRTAYVKTLGPQGRQRAVAFTKRHRDGLLMGTGVAAVAGYFYYVKMQDDRSLKGTNGVPNYGGSGITAKPTVESVTSRK